MWGCSWFVGAVLSVFWWAISKSDGWWFTMWYGWTYFRSLAENIGCNLHIKVRGKILITWSKLALKPSGGRWEWPFRKQDKDDCRAQRGLPITIVESGGANIASIRFALERLGQRPSGLPMLTGLPKPGGWCCRGQRQPRMPWKKLRARGWKRYQVFVCPVWGFVWVCRCCLIRRKARPICWELFTVRFENFRQKTKNYSIWGGI